MASLDVTKYVGHIWAFKVSLIGHEDKYGNDISSSCIAPSTFSVQESQEEKSVFWAFDCLNLASLGINSLLWKRKSLCFGHSTVSILPRLGSILCYGRGKVCVLGIRLSQSCLAWDQFSAMEEGKANGEGMYGVG
ncbi:hypothetical protein Bpfe_021440 [Biomphalaria pfeifferi]|uniref:Uncharacterized protein n=1 Tax=Biomphalaria pfeifferi TaxID=112525 RepID=A0AAD8F3N9_BIOPF|nr:hypothetical protein Bpfe_021440 [Biomphalaria pfeifferi]